MNFDSVEGLSEEQILSLYDNILENEEKISYYSCGTAACCDSSSYKTLGAEGCVRAVKIGYGCGYSQIGGSSWNGTKYACGISTSDPCQTVGRTVCYGVSGYHVASVYVRYSQ